MSFRRSSGQSFHGVNGVEDAGITDSNDYSVATTILGARTVSGNIMKGSISGPCIWNRALTAAEVALVFQQGAPGGGEFNSASNANVIASVSRNSDFSAGATDWTSTNGATVSVVSGNASGYLGRGRRETHHAGERPSRAYPSARAGVGGDVRGVRALSGN